MTVHITSTMKTKECRWCHKSNVIFDPEFVGICVDCGTQKRKVHLKNTKNRGDTSKQSIGSK